MESGLDKRNNKILLKVADADLNFENKTYMPFLPDKDEKESAINSIIPSNETGFPVSTSICANYVGTLHS